MLETNNLSIAYQSNELIFQNVNFGISKGECLAVIGENGSGKSTLGYALIKIIPNLIRAEVSGKCLINEGEYDFPTAKKIIGYTFQDADSQIISLGLFRVKDISDAYKNSRTCTKRFANDHIREQTLPASLAELSEGQKQKIILKLITSANFSYFILDEPSANLDQIEKDLLMNRIKMLLERGKTIIILTHDIDLLNNLRPKCLHLDKADSIFYANYVNFQKNFEMNIKEYDTFSKSKSKFAKLQSNTKVVSLKEVNYRYNKKSKFSLKDININIFEGEIVGIAGRNGSGKSTLIKLIGGVIKPNSGKIEYLTNDKKKGIPNSAILFQNPNKQIFCATVEEELQFGLKNFNVPRNDINKRIEWAFNYFKLDTFISDPFALSFGQKKILALASTVILDSKILLLDEPDLSLDMSYRKLEAQLFSDLIQKKKSIIIATHNKFILDNLCSRILYLEEGKIREIREI